MVTGRMWAWEAQDQRRSGFWVNRDHGPTAAGVGTWQGGQGWEGKVSPSRQLGRQAEGWRKDSIARKESRERKAQKPPWARWNIGDPTETKDRPREGKKRTNLPVGGLLLLASKAERQSFRSCGTATTGTAMVLHCICDGSLALWLKFPSPSDCDKIIDPIM